MVDGDTMGRVEPKSFGRAALAARDGSLALAGLVAALQQVGDGVVEVLLALFGVIIALSGFAVTHLERVRHLVAPFAIPIATPIAIPTAARSAIPTITTLGTTHNSIVEAAVACDIASAEGDGDDDGGNSAFTPSPSAACQNDQTPVVPMVDQCGVVGQNLPVYNSTLPHGMSRPFNCKGGLPPHPKWYAVSIGTEPGIYVEPHKSKGKVDGFNRGR